jgi:hypothetical protein
MKSICMSSGHGKYIRGAAGSPVPPYLDEVDEARRVVDRTAEYLRNSGVTVDVFHDNTSHDQSTNLNAIVNHHNAQSRELDVSVHLNANATTSQPMGTECLYKTQEALAKEVSHKIAVNGEFKDRGPKYRSDLKFLNSTNKPAVLVEVCFVDSKADSDLYRKNFDHICMGLAEALAGKVIEDAGPTPPWEKPPVTPIDPSARATIAKGDKGEDVEELQEILGIVPLDGDFGNVTHGGVVGFQQAAGLTADGVCGPQTWAELDDLAMRKEVGDKGLLQSEIDDICKIAKDSAIANYSWKDRGKVPIGYTCGVACCFGLALKGCDEGDPIVDDMAQADRNNPDKDALSWYRDEFKKLGMDNSEDGAATLRHLFCLILGLGPRESSGRYPEGRDMSAENVSSETAECGLYQTSWNISSCSKQIPFLLTEFWDNPNGFLEVFQDGCSPDSNDLANFGGGDGAKHQFLSKYAPAYHVFVTALGLRYLRQHWGPLNRREVEIRADADKMLLAVQKHLRF